MSFPILAASPPPPLVDCQLKIDMEGIHARTLAQHVIEKISLAPVKGDQNAIRTRGPIKKKKKKANEITSATRQVLCIRDKLVQLFPPRSQIGGMLLWIWCNVAS